jgi:ABC-type Fe3+-hydroxamate transport system substrate-binding protein
VIALIDDFGREIDLPAPATRVVSLVPSLTETICTFGRRDCLVGVTRHCTQPAGGLEGVARVGGTKNPDIGAIRALRPDLVIANAEENRREDFDNLVAGGLKVLVTFPHRVADVPGLLRLLGRAVGAAESAERTAGELETALALPPPPIEHRVFCPIWKNPWMTFNSETFADDVIGLIGGSNVFRLRGARYFEITLEEVAAAEPEVILLPDEPYVFSRKDLAALTPLADTPALRDEQVRFVDGKALFWFGTRMPAALSYLRALFEQTTT